MNALILTLFVSLMLAAAAMLLFTWGYLKGEHEHSDRLALLPLEEDATEPGPQASLNQSSKKISPAKG